MTGYQILRNRKFTFNPQEEAVPVTVTLHEDCHLSDRPFGRIVECAGGKTFSLQRALRYGWAVKAA